MTCAARRKKHEKLVDGMATRLGLDLDLLSMKGALDQRARDDAIVRCMGCLEADGCNEWLEAHPKADKTPDYCRNTALFETLGGNM